MTPINISALKSWLVRIAYFMFCAFTFSAIDLALHLRNGRDVGGWHEVLYGAVETATRRLTEDTGR